MNDIKGADILLKVQIGHLDPDDLSLDQMEALYKTYGKSYWRDKRFSFKSDPLYYNTDSQLTPRKRPW